MDKNCSTCKHNPVDEHCKGCRGEKDGNTHWEPEPFINKPCISECVRHEKMTNKEAIEYNKNLRMYMKLSDKNQPCKFLEENYIALDMAIKALEQQTCEDWHDVPFDEMTLEQARQAVKDLRKKLADHLEQEPCEDAISRQAAIDALYDWSEHSMTDAEAWHIKQVIGDIKSLPSAQLEKCTEERTKTHACVCIIDKLKAKSYSESEYGVPEFDANKVIQLSDAIEIIKDYCGAESEEA